MQCCPPYPTRKCIGPSLTYDIFSYLELSQHPVVAYKKEVRVRTDALKAEFGSVLASRIKVSFEIPFPSVIIKQVDTDAMAENDGTKWAPIFS